MTVLLDANVLIALLVDDHVHHGAAENWFVGMSGNFATCPITQGSLMRLLVREGQPTSAAREVLNGTSADPRHEFWPDDIPYTDVPIQGIVGHRCFSRSRHYLQMRPFCRSASDNYTGRPVTLKKVAQFVRGAADLAADRCERPDRERPGAMHRNAHMPPVGMPHHMVAASDPFQFPAALAECLDDVLPGEPDRHQAASPTVTAISLVNARDNDTLRADL